MGWPADGVPALPSLPLLFTRGYPLGEQAWLTCARTRVANPERVTKGLHQQLLSEHLHVDPAGRLGWSCRIACADSDTSRCPRRNDETWTPESQQKGSNSAGELTPQFHADTPETPWSLPCRSVAALTCDLLLASRVSPLSLKPDGYRVECEPS